MLTHHMITKTGSRPVNEDSAICARKGQQQLFLVADGLGGHGRGEVASALVAEQMRRFVSSHGGLEPDGLLREAILDAQQALLAEQARVGTRTEMKTTVVALLCQGDRLCWGHVGDSRLYAFRKNKVLAQTLDHSVPQMLVLSGKLSPKKIRCHPQRNLLLRVLGVEWERPKQEISSVTPVKDYQAFLLCSDGFWELITEKEMCRLLKKSASAEQWLERMTEIVEKNGAGKEMDNYTAIAVWRTED